jgi:DNA-binding CsgD family transcriptional regulator
MIRERGRRIADGGKPTEKCLDLSLRQKQVLTLLSEGKTMQETSHYLGLSYNTVNTHIRRLYKKLGVENRTCAIVAFISRKTPELCPLCGSKRVSLKQTAFLK